METFSAQVCRTCMVGEGENKTLHFIFDAPIENSTKTIADLLLYSTRGLKINYKDDLPKNICEECLSSLLGVIDFQKMCLQSQRNLNQILADEAEAQSQAVTESTAIEIVLLSNPLDFEEVILKEENSYQKNYSTNNNEAEFVEKISSARIFETDNERKASSDEINMTDNEEKPGIDGIEESAEEQEDYFDTEAFDESEEMQFSDEEHDNESLLSDEEYDIDTDSTYLKSDGQVLATHTEDQSGTEELQLRDEKTDVHTEKRVKCKYCAKYFPHRRSFLTHLHTHLGKNIYECRQCPERFPSRIALRKHCSLHEKDKKTRFSRVQKGGTKVNSKAKVTEPQSAETVAQNRKNVCKYCNKEFQVLQKLREHVRVHTGERPYLCTICGKRFFGGKTYRQHLRGHTSQRIIECPECPRKFNSLMHLNSHKTVHLKIKPFICDICGSSFTKAYLLKQHSVVHNGEAPHKCEFCEMRFAFRSKLERHQRVHTGEKPYKCKYCEKTFAQVTNLTEHLRMHLGANIYACELCPQRFPLAREKRAHFMTHKNDDEATRIKNLKALQEQEAKMNETVSVEPNRNEYKKRSRLNSDENTSPKQNLAEDLKHVCQYCNKGFKTSNHLVAHLRRHTDEHKYESFDGTHYECPDCPKKFTSFSALKAHKPVHSTIKSHVCDTCGAAFVRPSSLKQHMITHQEEKPFQCDQCDLGFPVRSRLLRHQRTHRSEKPYKCEYCAKDFTQKINLTEHLRIHLGKNVHRCQLCPKRFPLAKEAREHFASHKNDDEATRLKNLKAC